MLVVCMFSGNQTIEEIIEPLRLVNHVTWENGATAVLPTCSRTSRTTNYQTLIMRQKYEDSIKVFRLSTIRLKWHVWFVLLISQCLSVYSWLNSGNILWQVYLFYNQKIIDPYGTYIQSQVNTGINIGIIYNWLT